jgi:hypothetical protein
VRKSWRWNVAAAVLAAGVAAGCGAGDKGEERAVNDAAASSQQVSLTGCVGVGPGSANEFALQNVRMAPLAEQPSDQPTYTSHNAIREGSWVRLAAAGGNDELRSHVGKRVTVVGAVRDTGADTLGTSGVMAAPQEAQPSTDHSQAAANEHHSDKVRKEAGAMCQDTMANGTAPQVVVQRIEGTGEPCDPNLKDPQNRR